ncbi:MAG: ATP-binding protein [Desulfobacteraceae bacterium]
MEALIHVLHLEDSLMDAELVQAKLEENDLACRMTRVETREAFEDILRQKAADLILADYRLPGYDGMSALRLAQEVCPETPFIFVSGALGEEAAIDALTQGATDYVLKQNLSRLVPSVRRALQEAQNRQERAQAEQQVALMSFALNEIHEAACMIDANGRFHYANDEACRLLGYSRDKLRAMNMLDIHRGLSRQGWHAHWSDLKSHGALTYEGELCTSRGRHVPVEINANYFAYEGRNYNLALVHDITERKQVERERLANLQFFESMDRINRAIQGAQDIDGMMRAVLDAALSIFDGDRAYLMHPCAPEADTWTTPMERHRPEYPGVQTLGPVMPMTPEVAATLRIILASDHPVQFGPGTEHPLPADVARRFGFKSFMAVALYPKVGKPWQFGLHQCAHVRIWTLEEERKFQEIGRRLADGLTTWLTHRDLQISERRYRRLNQELEERVAERTQALEASHTDLEKAYRDLQTAHSRMLQQEKMASIGQLAAGVAHEINNPLSFIISNLGALGDYSGELAQFQRALEGTLQGLTPDSPAKEAWAALQRLREEMEVDFILEDIQQLVGESLEGGNRMKQIVENLKSFARLDEAGYKMADLNQGLETTLNILRNEIKNKATVNRSYGDIPQVLCNPGQLNQVFVNLLLNAVQAIDHQGEIDIVTRQEGEAIVIEIADTGGGILPDQLDRIFEPFFTAKEVGKGTGLGLSIVYDIVEKHGGEITVNSRPGQGTCFTIRLPIRSE